MKPQIIILAIIGLAVVAYLIRKGVIAYLHEHERDHTHHKTDETIKEIYDVDQGEK